MLADLRQKKLLNDKLKIPSLRELIQIVINLKQWHLRNAYQKWCFFYGIGKICLKPFGIPLYEEDQTIALRAYFFATGLIGYMSLSLYTTFHYICKGDFSKGLPCTCLLGVTISVCILPVLPNTTTSWHSSLKQTVFQISSLAYVIFTEKRKTLNYLTSYGGRYIYHDNKQNTEYNQICSNHIDGTIRTFFIKMLIMDFFYAISQVWPLYKRIKYGTRTTLTEVKFPVVTEDSNAEYIDNLILQALALTVGGLVHIAIEVAMELADSLSAIITKLVEYDLVKFRGKIEDKSFTRVQLRLMFKNIIKEALYSDLYVSHFIDYPKIYRRI